MRLAGDRGRFISRQRGPAGAQVTTVNRRGWGGFKCTGAASNQMSTCVTGLGGFPSLQSGRHRGLRREIKGMTEMSALKMTRDFRGEKEKRALHFW